jgi:hypothetical protein
MALLKYRKAVSIIDCKAELFGYLAKKQNKTKQL